MEWRNEMTWCNGCGVEITWGPVVIRNQVYCCQDCAQGYGCTCSERLEMDEEIRGSGADSAPAYSIYQA